MDAPADIPTAYNIDISPVVMKHGKMVRVQLTFVQPPQLAGQEYASFTLPYEAAGIFARKMEIARRQIKPGAREKKRGGVIPA